MNLSLLDTGGAALVVSQFTLYGDVRRGRRPGFDRAAPAERRRRLYEEYLHCLRALGVRVETGVFQAHMQVELVNDGPVTISWIRRKRFDQPGDRASNRSQCAWHLAHGPPNVPGRFLHRVSPYDIINS